MKNLDNIIDDIKHSTSIVAPQGNKVLDNDDLNLVLDSLGEGVIIADTDGHFRYFNAAAEKILGIGSKELPPAQWVSVYGCYLPDRVTPYSTEQLPLARAMNGEVVSNELMFIKNPERPEGIYIAISASPLRDSEGSINGGTIVFRDTTAYQLAVTQLKESEERNHAQFKGFPIPTYIWQYQEDDFILIDYNNAAEKFTNQRIKAYSGISVNKMYEKTPFYDDIISDFTKCFFEKKIVKREMQYRFQSSGKTRQLKVTYVFVSPDLIMVHTEDITERKRAQEKSKKLSNAVEQTADSVVITDANSVIEYVNPAFEETTGYTIDEVRGLTPRILQSGKHDKEFYKNLWSIIKSGRPFKGTILNKKKNGELYWGEQTITPMKDDDGRITNYVAVTKDVTEIMKKREHEFLLGLVQELQKRLYKTTVSVPGFDIAGVTFPVDQTNGDYFDIFEMPDGKIGLAVGDVCGHGICSALIMSETRAYLRAFAKTESDPAVIFNMLNQELTADLDEHHFVTMIFVVLDPHKNSLVYASAGHVTGFIQNSEGTVHREMKSTGIPLGFLEEYAYEKSESIQLFRGNSVILLTDGITEAQSNQEEDFGVQRALDIVKGNTQSSARNILEKLHQQVLLFSQNNQEDDITSIICKFDGD